MNSEVFNTVRDLLAIVGALAIATILGLILYEVMQNYRAKLKDRGRILDRIAGRYGIRYGVQKKGESHMSFLYRIIELLLDNVP